MTLPTLQDACGVSPDTAMSAGNHRFVGRSVSNLNSKTVQEWAKGCPMAATIRGARSGGSKSRSG